ncbi:MAG TPA: glycosyltransferase family 4 protein [Candidatus Paceibacterota bacterium]
MKVLYLFNGTRAGLKEKIQTGEYHGGGFWGMLQLLEFGIESDYMEIEQTYSAGIVRFIRKHVPVYGIHLPIFWKIFSYDIVFTSSAFMSQLAHAVLHIRKPIWVMHDFSIMSLIGEGKTLKQKMFRYMVERSGGIVTLSNDETDRLKKAFPHLASRIELVPFGVDLDFFKPKSASAGEGVIAVGFDPERDWKTLAEAAKSVSVPITVATRESRIAHLRPLPANVTVRQFSVKELVSAYDDAAIIVVPLNTSSGVNDAMGLSTVYEGMAMGKPVIATRTKATETYIKDGENGLLVSEGDAAALASTINSLLANPEKSRKIGAAGRMYAEKHLDIHECGGKLAAFFKALKIK